MDLLTTNTTIKSWAEADRPREKLLDKGKHILTEAELMAIIIGSGTRKITAVELSRQILNKVGNNLAELGKLNVKDLKKFNGIGEAKAVGIVAALELGRRRRLSDSLHKEKISSSNNVAEIFYPLLADSPREEFWILLLNRANKVLRPFEISKGGISGTVADTRLIFKTALDHLASSIILCHNHPSGNIKPSEADIQLTKKIREAGALLEIPVLDHIIIGENQYFSFADEGLL